MNYDEAWAVVEGAGVMSIRLEDGSDRRYIFECAGVVGKLGLPCVEVGVCYGGTTAMMALAGAMVVAVDDWTLGTRENFIDNIRRLGLSDMVELREGRSENLASSFTNRSVGLVNIDANHWGDGPYKDYLLYSPKIAVGGFMVVSAASNGHPDVTIGMVKWLAQDANGDFVFDQDFRRIEPCGHRQITTIGFRRVR